MWGRLSRPFVINSHCGMSLSDVAISFLLSILLAEDHTLVISNASTSDSGTYRCDAVNEYGAASTSVTIQVEGNLLFFYFFIIASILAV